MRPAIICLAMLASAAVTGCASQSNTAPLVTGSIGAGAPTRPSVGYLGRGSYQPTADEKSFDCKSLAFALDKSITVLNSMPAQAAAQRAAPPDTMVRVFERASGKAPPIVADFHRERARALALEQLLGPKGCPPVDVTGKTQSASDKMSALPSG